MWSSRQVWMDDVRAWTASPDFAVVCASAGVSIASATVGTVAALWAEHADHSTGRHASVAREKIAALMGCSIKTVSRAWKVLGAAGWAVEVFRGHGSSSTHPTGKRPSIWHLIPRRPDAPAAADSGDNVPLPTESGSCSLTPVRSYSPNARGRAREDISTKNQHPKSPRRRGRATPRPLALQRLAAGLVTPVTGPDDRRGSGERAALILGLDHGHIGAICDALAQAGINPAAWTATTITAALNADMRRTGMSWPDRLDRPGAFLAWRLRRMLAWPGNATKNTGSTAAGGLDQNQQGAALEQSRSASLTACQDTDHHAGPGLRQSAPPAPTAAPRNLLSSTACSGCGSADAPRRPYLPAARAHVCDTCWEAFSTCA